MNPMVSISTPKAEAARVTGERRSQQLVTAFVVSGLIFMLLPGTFLGVWNLLSISEQHQPSSISEAWLQAHGQAQIFGWIGSIILGIGFYSLTKMRSTRAFLARAAWIVWVLWTVGVLVRWLGGVTAGKKPEVWMRLVFAGTILFLVALIANYALLFRQSLVENSPALPHVTDQQFVVLAVLGVLVPTIWGFNTRLAAHFPGAEAARRTRSLCGLRLQPDRDWGDAAFMAAGCSGGIFDRLSAGD